jgi:hypothetical protein
MNENDKAFSIILISACLIMLTTSASIWFIDRPVLITVQNNTVLLNNTVVYNETVVYTNISTSKQWFGFEKSKQCIGFDISQSTKYSLEGNSMQPTLNPGNTLYTKQYNPRISLVPGDIVTASSGSNRVIHRVIGVYEDGFALQGDNNPEPDLMIYLYTDIINVVCGVTY